MVEMARLVYGKGRSFGKSKLSIHWYGCQMNDGL